MLLGLAAAPVPAVRDGRRDRQLERRELTDASTVSRAGLTAILAGTFAAFAYVFAGSTGRATSALFPARLQELTIFCGALAGALSAFSVQRTPRSHDLHGDRIQRGLGPSA